MEPSVLGLAIVDGGPDRKIKLVRSPGLDEVTACFYLIFLSLSHLKSN